MYRLKLKAIPSFKFIIGMDFIVQMFRESRKNLPLNDLLSEIEKAEISLSPSLSGSCLSTVPPFPRTKAVNSSCLEEAGRAMLLYECPGRCSQKTKFFSRADTVQWDSHVSGSFSGPPLLHK